MKLRTGLINPSSSVPPLEKKQERVTFNAGFGEPLKPVVQETKEEVNATPEVPRLTKVDKGIPPLQPVRRVKKTVELSSPQSATAASVSAEPESGGDRGEVGRNVENGNSLAPTGANISVNRDELDSSRDGGNNDSSVRSTSTNSGKPRVQLGRNGVKDSSESAERGVPREGESTDGPIPKLTKVEKSSTDIPPLVSFNTMEVAHLLLGRSVEDEEVVLIQSFSERFIRSKNHEEFQAALVRRVSEHVARMNQNEEYDFRERSANRRVEVLDLTPGQKTRGVEWAAGYKDNGAITEREIAEYARDQGIVPAEALAELKGHGFEREPSFVYTWALVKVKIGHDFGSFKLSQLMPNL